MCFAKADDASRAVAEMNGSEIDGRTVKVEKARRARGYEKTPGRCKLMLFVHTTFLVNWSPCDNCLRSRAIEFEPEI